jgi:hypothetical protein
MSDESEILKIHHTWLELEESGKGLQVLNLCERDVVWLIPGLGMLEGIDDIKSFLSNQSEATITRIETFDVEVEVSGTLAVKKARFCTTLMDEVSEVQVKGAHIWTLRRNNESNQWQVSSVAWSIEDDCS